MASPRNKLEGGHVGLEFPGSGVGLCHSDTQHSSEQVRTLCTSVHIALGYTGFSSNTCYRLMTVIYVCLFSLKEKERGGAKVVHAHGGGKPARLPSAPRPSSADQEHHEVGGPIPLSASGRDLCGMERWNRHTTVRQKVPDRMILT